ncbi:MAG: T9SS type A sorting domain-containing protein [Agriterribacter sp.]
MKSVLLIIVCLVITGAAAAQNCNAAGNETSYGTNNVWIGYVYNNMNFTNYRGYVTEGTSSNPDFDENFGGDDVTYSTNGCSVQTSTYSVRYKLRKNFANGTYEFVVGGDDGFRLSLDGGSTWVINRWSDQSYTSQSYTAVLSGNYDMVLEFYENGGANRISFAVTAICIPTGNPAAYGTGNQWNGYVYDGTNFDTYVGMVTKGTTGNPDFDEDFGGSNTQYATGSCNTQTETFSVRYRRTQTFANGNYIFTVGGDDGYRFSIDGGATWLINNWNLHSYASTTSNAIPLNGSYNLVLEYYENTGDNRVTFAQQRLMLLPVSIEAFTATAKKDEVQLNWLVSSNSTPRSFEIEKSTDGALFSSLGTVASNSDWSVRDYNFTDHTVTQGISYYRLRITDASGVITYSKITTVNITVAQNKPVSVYPTVVTGGSFYIRTAQAVRNAVVTVSDFSGRVVIKQHVGNITAGQTTQVHASNLTHGKGMYSVVIASSDANLFAGKIVVQ